MRARALFVLLLGACATPPVPAPTSASAAAPARPPLVTAVYREPAVVFETLDNVSLWWKDKCNPEYRADWERRFGVIGDDDAKRFATYKELRKRTYAYPSEEKDPHTNASGLFAPNKPADRVAEAFYGASTMDEGFARVSKVVGPEDVATLRAFYAAYEPRMRVILDESRGLAATARQLSSSLSGTKTEAFFEKMLRFYGVTRAGWFEALVLYWPSGPNVTAHQRGSFLLLKGTAEPEIVVHELAHWVSSQRATAEKRALSTRFLGRCDPTEGVRVEKILEEPLAVAQQKVFLRQIAPERFDENAGWYSSDAWISPLAKAIFERVQNAYDRGETLDASLVDGAAAACEELWRAR